MANNSQSITVRGEDPRTEDAARLLGGLSAELASITGSTGEASFDLSDMEEPGAVFAVARDSHGSAVGCGALRPLGGGAAEVKRVYACKKGNGVGSAVLSFLEQRAKELGYATLRLETRKVNERAVSFYLSKGYTVIENFGKYRGREEAICFEKKIPVASKEDRSSC